MSSSSSAYNYLHYRKGVLQMGVHALAPVAKKYHGPAYLYDLELMKARARMFKDQFRKISVYYAIKANNHPRIVKTFRQLGLGVDVVSAGEIRRALTCGVSPRAVIFSGVGKTIEEIDFALRSGVYQINVESISELRRVAERARALSKIAPVLFRLNPDVNVKTHPYIATGFRSNKFGIDSSALPEVVAVLRKYAKHLSLKGVSLHIGSQLTDLSNFDEALKRAVPVYKELQAVGFALERFDIGGGLGIDYETQNLAQEEKALKEYAKIIERHLVPLGCEIQAEPGRWIVGHAGILLCQIQYIKKMPEKDFLIVDSGIHHLIRPALYKSYHRILPLKQTSGTTTREFHVAGPICESSDVLAWDRPLPVCKEGDFLIVADAGAYGASMSSDYNLREKAHEIFL